MNFEMDLKILTYFDDKRGNLTFRVENILDQWDSNLLYNLYKMVRLKVLKYMPSTSRVDCRGISTVKSNTWLSFLVYEVVYQRLKMHGSI